MLKTILTTFLVGYKILFCTSSFAQVDSVKYLLEYNSVEDEFDMKMYVAGGSANTIAQRTQANAQISVIVPSGATLEISKRYMPLQNNHYFTGTIPNPWSKGNRVINPEILKNFDVYSIVPQLSPSYQYNAIHTGDTVTLFSIKITLKSGCFNDVKLYDNKEFANCGSGLNGGDFSQGFTMGGIKQLYAGNLKSAQIGLILQSFTLEVGQELVLTSSGNGASNWETWSDDEGIELLEIAPGIVKVTTSEEALRAYTFINRNEAITDIACLSVEPKTTSNENYNFGTFQLFPNPGTDVINIHEGNFDSIEVRDITGHLIWQSAKKVKEIDILDWKTGVYIATFQNKNIQYSRKFVKL